MNHLKTQLVLLLFCVKFSLAQQVSFQKKLITNNTWESWGGLRGYNISNNGKYAFYEYALSSKSFLVIQSITNGFKFEINNGSTPVFTGDSRKLIYKAPHDTLVIFDLTKKTREYIAHVRSFKTAWTGKDQLLAFGSGRNLIFKNLTTAKTTVIVDVKDFMFNPTGSALLIRTKEALSWINLADNKTKLVSKNPNVSILNIRFDKGGTQLAFITTDKRGNALRYYKTGMDSAEFRVSNRSSGIKEDLTIAKETPSFSSDGKLLFFKLLSISKTKERDPDVITNNVDVWNYKDAYLQSQQLTDIASGGYTGVSNTLRLPFTAVIPVTGGNLLQLEDQNIKLAGAIGNRYVLVQNTANVAESYWNKSQIIRSSLVSLLDGHRMDLGINNYGLSLSPNEQFVTWFDRDVKHWFSYEINTGVTRNMTINIKVPLINVETNYLDYLEKNNSPVGMAGWFADDSSLLIYDDFDIWQVDPKGIKMPLNITAGYGRSMNILLRLAIGQNQLIRFHKGNELLLAGFQNETKNNGFFKIKPGMSETPKVCVPMGACIYYFPAFFIGGPELPKKAKNAEIYLFTKQTASEAPNLHALTDFNNIHQLSNIQPGKGYNWMTSELVSWKMYDGKMSQGILYKPENFDPSKKYPLIFTYYERFSDGVFLYKSLRDDAVSLDIPWYVSNGYLVFVPDIYYTAGHTGKSVVNAVESAAKYLGSFPWVDSKRMGLQGHSFGGFETNFLITHSNLFAAAQEGAGMSNSISWYGDLGFGGKSLTSQYETGQSNLRTTPWERPDIYVENSPIFFVDKVHTPLLIMHNKNDDAVSFAQGVQMFTALRRLQKPVWMLQYDGESHGINDEDCILDFTIRRQQFFDHYLKGKPAPKWMTEGINAKDKGIISGLELDLSGSKP